MTAPRVWTFFYGSFINLEVLAAQGLVPERHEVARLSGFDIQIRPLANLVRAEQHCVYGILATATHGQLGRLYDYARDGLGGTYAISTPPKSRRRPPATTWSASSLRRGPSAFPLGTWSGWSAFARVFGSNLTCCSHERLLWCPMFRAIMVLVRPLSPTLATIRHLGAT
jgi:hypothetical protein